jgi:hypothetical protein
LLIARQYQSLVRVVALKELIDVILSDFPSVFLFDVGEKGSFDLVGKKQGKIMVFAKDRLQSI